MKTQREKKSRSLGQEYQQNPRDANYTQREHRAAHDTQ